MFVTYKITCTITGKYYIGSHKTEDINDNYMGSGRFIRQSIAQYGVENHIKEILGIFDTRGESLELEHRLVKEKRQLEKEQCLNASNDGFSFDYVNATGKNVYKRTPEQRQQQLDRLQKGLAILKWKRENVPGYLEEVCQRGLQNLKRYHSTHPAYWLGRQHTEETKQKMRDRHKGMSCGSKNSQFGTYWITNGHTNMKWSDNRGNLPEGYQRGRVL